MGHKYFGNVSASTRAVNCFESSLHLLFISPLRQYICSLSHHTVSMQFKFPYTKFSLILQPGNYSWTLIINTNYCSWKFTCAGENTNQSQKLMIWMFDLGSKIFWMLRRYSADHFKSSSPTIGLQTVNQRDALYTGRLRRSSNFSCIIFFQAYIFFSCQALWHEYNLSISKYRSYIHDKTAMT